MKEKQTIVVYGATVKALSTVLYSEGVMSNDRIAAFLNVAGNGELGLSAGSGKNSQTWANSLFQKRLCMIMRKDTWMLLLQDAGKISSLDAGLPRRMKKPC